MVTKKNKARKVEEFLLQVRLQRRVMFEHISKENDRVSDFEQREEQVHMF